MTNNKNRKQHPQISFKAFNLKSSFWFGQMFHKIFGLTVTILSRFKVCLDRKSKYLGWFYFRKLDQGWFHFQEQELHLVWVYFRDLLIVRLDLFGLIYFRVLNLVWYYFRELYMISFYFREPYMIWLDFLKLNLVWFDLPQTLCEVCIRSGFHSLSKFF